MDAVLGEELGRAIEEMASEICPDITTRPMYGGTVYEMLPSDPKTLVAGFFVYENHASLELSNGSGFDDPRGLLEGKGKFRRHLKLRSLADLGDKHVRFYLEQALA